MYDKDKIRQAIWDNPTPATGLYFERRGQEQWSRQRLDGTETARSDKSVLKYGRNGELMVIYNGSSYPESQSIWDFLKWRYSTNEPIEMYKAAADAYGIQADLSALSASQRTAIAKRAEDATIIAAIAKYLTEQLQTPQGAATRDYLRRRSLEPSERMGAYSKAIRAGLLRYLTDGFKTIPATTMEEKLNEQLTRWNADDYGLVIPYYSGRKCIGFCLRRTTDKITYQDKDGREREKPKYLFSLNTNNGGSFEKNGYCGNLNPKKPVILVEGALDAERCKQAGFDNVMALGGKTPTDGEVKTLLRYGVKSVIQVPDYEFDADGNLHTEAVEGTIKALSPHITGRWDGEGFVSFKIAQLYNSNPQERTKQDADSFIKEFGADAFGAVLDNARAWYDWQFENAARHHGGEELAADALAIYCSAKSPTDAELIKLNLQGQAVGVYAKMKEAGVSAAWLRQIDAGGEATTYRQKITATANELNEAIRNNATADTIAAILRRASRLQSYGGQARFAAQVNATREYYENLVRMKPDELRTDWALYNKDGRKLRNISFPVGYYSVIAAPTGFGKTAFLMQTAINLARSTHKRYLYVSVEEDEEQLYIRSLASYMGSQGMNTASQVWSEWDGGYINPKGELRHNIKQGGTLTASSVQIPLFDDLPDDTAAPSVSDMIEKQTGGYWVEVAPYLKFFHSSNGEVNELCGNIAAVIEDMEASGVEVGGVFLDYIQLMRTSEARYSRSEELFAICTQLNAFAKDKRVAIIVGSQTNREATKQGRNSVGIEGIDLTNLGDSTGIERTAAEVYLLLRPDRQIKQDDIEGVGINDVRGARLRRCVEVAPGGERLQVKPDCLYIENLKARNYAPDGYALIKWDAATGYITNLSDR